MTHSYIAYIDETGDDGLVGRFRQPGGEGGPSHWLGIGATVWRASRDLDMVSCAKEIVGSLPSKKRNKPLQFTELNHAQRVMAIKAIATQPIRICSVFAYKPIIPEGTYVEKNQFYYYMTRYLIERISWLCRDFRKHVPEGDGKVRIIFSRRGGMDYSDFQNYLRKLAVTDDPAMRIHWPVIDIEHGVEARDHGSRYGLQLADIAMGGLRSALEFDLYGNLEPSFAEKLRPLVYKRNANYLSYGAKIVPSPEDIQAYSQARVAKADLSDWLRLFG